MLETAADQAAFRDLIFALVAVFCTALLLAGGLRG